MFTHAQAKSYYDRIGAHLDSQAFYEEPALRELSTHLDLKSCRTVVEFGCGTGRFACEMLATGLPPDATYLGYDASSTMVKLTTERLSGYADRAHVFQTDGAPILDAPDSSVDRFVSTFVLDLLPEDDIRAILKEARRVLTSNGMLGMVSLTNGCGLLSTMVTALWHGLHWLSPWLVGGCRPIELLSFLDEGEWRIRRRKVITSFGVACEVVVASKIAGQTGNGDIVSGR